MGVACTLLLVEKSPPLYHAYVVMTMFLWTQIFSEYQFLKAFCRYLCGRVNDYYLKLIATGVFSVIILELLVRLYSQSIYVPLYSSGFVLDHLDSLIIVCGYLTGEELHRQKALYLVFLNYRDFCSFLSVQIITYEIWSTILCMAGMLVFVGFYSHAPSNSRKYPACVSNFILNILTCRSTYSRSIEFDVLNFCMQGCWGGDNYHNWHSSSICGIAC